jgi:hypothetical protein
LLLPDEMTGEKTIVPDEIFVFLSHHNAKDADGWYELWMLRMTYPNVWEHAMFSALPEYVEVWPTIGDAMHHVNKYNVDRPS